MRYLKTYKLFEASGVAEATLIYNQFLLDEFNKYCDIALESGDKNYSHTQEYNQEDLTQFIQDSLWPKYPISSMSVTYTLNKMTDDDFNKRFPGTGKVKRHIGTGACYNIGEEGGSAIKPAIDDRSDITLHLVLEIGAIISESFIDREGLSIEIESSITHELNHGYEGWNRMRKNKGQVSTDVTWALDINRAKIKKDIWKVWYDDIGFFIYWSEKHEINAMVQDAWPYVKRYDITDLKEKAPSWRFAQKMRDFNAQNFKQKMSDKILSYYPDTDVDMFLKRMKNGLANELIKSRESSISKKEDKPTLSGEQIRSMSVDKFLKYIEIRINDAGEKIQRNIVRLYSLKK
jgi:hypothetical protein